MQIKPINEKNKHLIRFDDSELDSRVYRFIPFESLLEILLFKRLTLPKINCWDDPYESYFFNTEVFHNNIDTSPSLKEITTRLYGQCWTLTPESDAMWRIYSNDKKGIRISTTLRKLNKLTNNSQSENDSICIGKVDYLSLDEIESSIKNEKYFTQIMNSEFFFGTLLKKRNEFKHENEIRIIYCSGHDFKSQLCHYSLIPNDFIDSITFDPRISKRFEALYSAAIKSMGYLDEVKKSALYKFNKLSIKVT
jgi:membrane-associated HD superfamily phosphohydrolase